MVDEGAAPAATAESLDTAAIQQVGDCTERVRTTAQWTIGAIGGLGTTLAGALTVTTLDNLDGWRFAAGACGLVLIVAGAGWAIYAVAAVLAPTNSALDAIVADPLLDHERFTKDILLGEPDLIAFNRVLQESETELVTAIKSGSDDAGLATARRRAGIYADRAERIRLIALYHSLCNTWRQAKWQIAGAMLVVALGVIGYELAASDQRTAPIRFPHVSAAEEMVFTFKPGALGDGVKAKCAAKRGGAVVPGGDLIREVLLLRPTVSCEGLFVRVAKSEVTAKPKPKPKPNAAKSKEAKARAKTNG